MALSKHPHFLCLFLPRAGIIFLFQITQVCLLSLLLFYSFSSKAQEANLGEITVQSQLEEKSEERPTSQSTVFKPSLFDTQVKSLSEVLSEQSGVQVNQYGGLGHYSTVSIRGSSAEQVSVYVDGVKINSAGSGAVDFSSLPLDQIEKIEIVKGAASSEFGSDALGGAVLIQTKKANAKKRSFEFYLGGGSFATLKTQESINKKSVVKY